MRYIVAVEKQSGQYEPHIFDSPEHFCSWYSEQPDRGHVLPPYAARLASKTLLPEVDHRTHSENSERTLPS